LEAERETEEKVMSGLEIAVLVVGWVVPICMIYDTQQNEMCRQKNDDDDDDDTVMTKRFLEKLGTTTAIQVQHQFCNQEWQECRNYLQRLQQDLGLIELK